MANSRRGSEGGEPRGARLSKRRPIEPGDEPDEVGRGRRDDVLQVGCGKAPIARPAESALACGLGARAFNAGPAALERLEGVGVLAGPGGMEGLVAFLGEAQRQTAPGVASVGALAAQRTILARLLSEDDLDHRLALDILTAIPPATVASLGTGRPPVDGELRDLYRSRRLSLPARVDLHRPHQVNRMSIPTL